VDWWSDWAYTSKSGTFTENSANTDQGNTPPNGATITATNGAEAYLIADTGSVFRVLPINGTAPADGDTLTASSGGTATYEASGSVQREVLRNPSNGVAMGYDQTLAFRVHIEDVDNGISYIGGRSVFADSSIHRNRMYSVGEFSETRPFALVGSTIYQDRDGDTVAQPITGTGGYWNNAIGTTVHPNNPKGCAIRIGEAGKVGLALCILYNHGGASGGYDQPCTRFSTGGAASEGDIGLNLWGCSISGGMRQLGFVALGGGDATTPERVPRTPEYIVVDACQILVEDTPDTIGGQYAIASDYTALWVRNCLVENPSGRTLIGGRFGGAAFQWAPNGGKDYYADPDVNWKPIKFQNNTFAYLGGTSPLADFTGLPASVTRANVIGFANTVIDVVDEDNVYIIDPAGFDTITVPLNSDSADFNADYQPTSSATGVYQAATGSNIPREDWAGVQRPSSGASKGYREPV
jgi:hypothetical protein